MAFTETVGRGTIDTLAYVGQLARLTGRAAIAVVTGPQQGQGMRYRRAVHQAMAVGIEAIPIISLITYFVGVILALQSAHELKRFGAMEFVPNAVALSLTRELGPLMTAIIVIGRSGSAFAAEIGTMKVSEEIDALETMALDPVRFLVAPKLVAMLLMMPCLTMWSDFMGITGRRDVRHSRRRLHLRLLLPRHTRCLAARRHRHRPDQELHVRPGDHRGRLPGRFSHRPGLRAGGPLDDYGGGEVYFSGDHG